MYIVFVDGSSAKKWQVIAIFLSNKQKVSHEYLRHCNSFGIAVRLCDRLDHQHQESQVAFARAPQRI